VSPPENESALEDRKKALLAAGFSKCQALSLLSGRSLVVAKDTSGQRRTIIDSTLEGSGLMAGVAEFSGCQVLNMLSYTPTGPLDDVRSNFNAAGAGWRRFSDSVSNAKLAENEKLELLFIGRDAVCNADERPSEPHCTRIRDALASGTSLQDAYGEIDILVPVRDRVNEKVGSADGQEIALGLLTQALCGSS
jgi:hypothetical protein